MVSARHALLSVSDKEGLVEFARSLRDLRFEFLATEGTAQLLVSAGVPATTVAEYTGLREGLGGRVKTLHPKIFAGILAPRGDEPELKALGALPIDLVVANLYPFESMAAKRGVDLAEVIENIDIGGVSLIRAAAKNASRVAVAVKPARYGDILGAYRSDGRLSRELREQLALEAFEYTSRYDAAIYNFLWRRGGNPLPPSLRIAYDKATDLRYGENPYQKAALYREPYALASAADAEKLQGPELSYNNLVDTDAALRIVLEFERPAAVVIKHTNPCGVAVQTSLAEAYRAAHDADPISAYGGVVGLNREVDEVTARAMRPHPLDAVIAPGFSAAALATLKPKKKGKFLILQPRGPFQKDSGTDMARILGGLLVQTTEFPELHPERWKVATRTNLTSEQTNDALFGIRVSRFVKSNSIVLVTREQTVGIGAGQMSRVDACMLACYKAGPHARGSVAVSDAYFPFRDGIDVLGKAGVGAIVQPGGSIRDPEVIAAASEYGIAMVFTGTRLFKH
jgi:phosphoribosylaminoimidazolecarboxamide formyltransferase / IMP cyclohydrolase